MCEELKFILDNGGPGDDHSPYCVVLERGHVTVFVAMTAAVVQLPDFVLEV